MAEVSIHRLILGYGPVARVLGRILLCPVVDRAPDDAGWHWPKLQPAVERQLVMVVPSFAGPSEVIRLNGQAWECPQTQDLSCVIFGLREDTAQEIARRDVFGRVSANDISTFEDWSNYVATVSEQSSLAQLLTQMSVVTACPRETWRAHARKASIVAPLSRAIAARDLSAVKETILEAARQDWDAVCPHIEAKRIVEFIQSVTHGVTPDWEKASSVFASLKRTT